MPKKNKNSIENENPTPLSGPLLKGFQERYEHLHMRRGNYAGFSLLLFVMIVVGGLVSFPDSKNSHHSTDRFELNKLLLFPLISWIVGMFFTYKQDEKPSTLLLSGEQADDLQDLLADLDESTQDKLALARAMDACWNLSSAVNVCGLLLAHLFADEDAFAIFLVGFLQLIAAGGYFAAKKMPDRLEQHQQKADKMVELLAALGISSRLCIIEEFDIRCVEVTKLAADKDLPQSVQYCVLQEILQKHDLIKCGLILFCPASELAFKKDFNVKLAETKSAYANAGHVKTLLTKQLNKKFSLDLTLSIGTCKKSASSFEIVFDKLGEKKEVIEACLKTVFGPKRVRVDGGEIYLGAAEALVSAKQSADWSKKIEKFETPIIKTSIFDPLKELIIPLVPPTSCSHKEEPKESYKTPQ